MLREVGDLRFVLEIATASHAHQTLFLWYGFLNAGHLARHKVQRIVKQVAAGVLAHDAQDDFLPHGLGQAQVFRGLHHARHLLGRGEEVGVAARAVVVASDNEGEHLGGAARLVDALERVGAHVLEEEGGGGQVLGGVCGREVGRSVGRAGRGVTEGNDWVFVFQGIVDPKSTGIHYHTLKYFHRNTGFGKVVIRGAPSLHLS
mmetsp:Transcript_4062/g.10010  ORF Transcript_4062/g.10010 Transcript_4062/m.10010 type:complete len:203 (-) Transcript_4062:3300-3908(-)